MNFFQKIKETFIKYFFKYKERKLFNRLCGLCNQPGYVHALAYLAFRDNTIIIDDHVTFEDISQQQPSHSRLVRTELSTLIGLFSKSKASQIIPPIDSLEKMLEDTECTLKELHKLMQRNGLYSLGAFIREAIFYGGESAYDFQYLDLSVSKYQNDDNWLLIKYGFEFKDIKDVIEAIDVIQNEKLNDLTNIWSNMAPTERSYLDIYLVTTEELSRKVSLEKNKIEMILDYFTLKNNNKFKNLQDFNAANAYPIIKFNEKYLVLSVFNLFEAFYETPFYCMYQDSDYENTAIENRGKFTEEVIFNNLKRVFKNETYKNVKLKSGKKDKGEIDVLTIFDKSLVVVQAKSKKLTLEARKGNDLILKDDFQKAVQKAYNQGLLCANLINEKKVTLFNENGDQINVPHEIKDIYIFCVVSDHYPALNTQARQFLKYEESNNIRAPLVMDLFYLDVISEFLKMPTYFLSFINKRTMTLEKIIANELDLLAFHLHQNLWVINDQLVLIGDEIGIELDIAFTVRRGKAFGNKDLPGILQCVALMKLIDQFQTSKNHDFIELGFELLKINIAQMQQVNNAIEKIIERFNQDSESHNFSFRSFNFGMTVYIGDSDNTKCMAHCKWKKETESVAYWYGISLNSKGNIQFTHKE